MCVRQRREEKRGEEKRREEKRREGKGREEKRRVIRFKNSFFSYFYMAVTCQRPRF
jgi:hypothetical protein